MMAAERKVTVYRRTDGGDGAFVGNKQSQANEPHALTPQRWWNMVLPLTLLVALIIASMVDLGIKNNAAAEPPNLSPSIGEIFEATNPYASLLYGTFAAALLTALFFALQHHADGKVTRPSPRGCLRASAPAPRDKRDVAQLAAEARPLLSIRESSNAFLFGIQRVFPAVVVLVLAWAIGMVQKDVGCNRFFQSYIEQNISSTSLPSVVFIFSSFMALATGTSWGTMTSELHLPLAIAARNCYASERCTNAAPCSLARSIALPPSLARARNPAVVFPIVVVPAWTVSGDPTVVIATVAAVLSGAVMGDHCSPISDTTVLSALASDCNLMKHVWTQLPYSIMTFVWCLLLGTIPVAAGAYPTGVATLLAIVCIPLTMLILGAPIVNKTGRFDLLTEFYLVVRAKVIKRPDEELEQLRSDTAAFYANGSSAVDTELLKQDDAPNAESA
jgi:Na+/H+ antiporter NhaC